MCVRQPVLSTPHSRPFPSQQPRTWLWMLSLLTWQRCTTSFSWLAGTLTCTLLSSRACAQQQRQQKFADLLGSSPQRVQEVGRQHSHQSKKRNAAAAGSLNTSCCRSRHYQPVDCELNTVPLTLPHHPHRCKPSLD